jgi:hypothetical protein
MELDVRCVRSRGSTSMPIFNERSLKCEKSGKGTYAFALAGVSGVCSFFPWRHRGVEMYVDVDVEREDIT